MFAELTLQQWILYGTTFGLVALFYFRILRPSATVLPPARASRRLSIEPDAPRTAAPPLELTRWEVSMHETGRELKAELDSKMIALQVLLRQAREEQAKLETLLDKAANASRISH